MKLHWKKRCTKCFKMKYASDFYASNASHCKLCVKAHVAKWKGKNRPRVNAGEARRRKANWPRFRDQKRACRNKLKLDVIAAYGGKCSCCGESEEAFLTLQHKNRGGTKEMLKYGSHQKLRAALKKLGWPKKNHTVFCANCNLGHAIYGKCPHQIKGRK